MEIFPNWTVIPVVFLLLVLAFVLNRFFFEPMRKILDARYARIEGAQKEAEDIRLASKERITEFDRRMREARRESDQHMAEVKNKALEERNSVISGKRAEVEKMLKDARAELQQKTEQARKELHGQAKTFAQRIASQILKRPVQTKS